MEYYKLRVDVSDVSSDSVVEYIQSISNHYAIVLEGVKAGNPHLHAWLGTLIKNKTIRSHIRKKYGSGNGVYSLKQCEERPIEYFAYMMKEGKPLWCGVEQEVIDEAVQYDVKVKEGIAKKKAEKQPVWKQILGAYLEDNGGTPTEWSTFQAERLIKFIVDWHRDTERMVRTSQIRAYYDTLCVYLGGASYSRYVNKLQISIVMTDY